MNRRTMPGFFSSPGSPVAVLGLSVVHSSASMRVTDGRRDDLDFALTSDALIAEKPKDDKKKSGHGGDYDMY